MNNKLYLPSRGVTALAFLASVCLGFNAAAQTAPLTNNDDDVITLDTFQVTTAQDSGYRAGNSVSATRVNTAIKDLPFSISAFTEQFIEDINASELVDVAIYAPGVTSGAKEFTQGNNRYSIRGFDGDVTPQRNGFVGNRYVDSANISRVEVVKGPASLLYGQITPGGSVNYITKRPESKSFTKVKAQIGTDSMWQAEIDANRRFMDGRVGARFIAKYDNPIAWASPSGGNNTLLAGALDFQVSENLKVIVDFESYKRDQEPLVGMKPNMSVPITATTGNFAQVAARAKAQAYIDVGNLNMGFLNYAPLPADFNYSSQNDYRRSDFNTANVEMNLKIGENWVARVNAGWNDFSISNKLTGLGEFTITPVAAAYNGATGPTRWDYIAELRANPAAVLADPSKTASALLTRRKRLEESFGENYSYQAELAGLIDLGEVTLKPLFGAFMTDDTSRSFRRESNIANPSTPNASTTPGQHFLSWNYNDPSTWTYDTNFDENVLPNVNSFNKTLGEDSAVYAVLTASFFDDRLIAIAGARYNKTESQNTDFRPTLTTPAGAPSVGDLYEATDTTPQFGVGYKVREDLLLFASYSESFYIENRSVTSWNPAYNPGLPSGASNRVTVSEPALPVTGAGYEVGIKTDFLDGRISSTVSLFHLERENRILRFRQTAPDGTFPTLTSQGTVDQSEGAEFEVTWSPTDNLQVFATFTKMDLQVTSARFPNLPSNADPVYQAAYVQAFNEAKGLILNSVPEGSAETLATLWTRYNFTDGALKDWWIGGGFVHTGDKAQRTANPTLFLEASTIWDLTVGKSWKSDGIAWGAQLSWKNIADTEYFNANQSRGQPGRLSFSLSSKF